MLPTITRRGYRPFMMSDFFNDNFFPVLTQRSNVVPAVNIRENEKEFSLALALPGIDKKDLKIEINKDLLTVSSEKEQENVENNGDYSRKEFSFSSFCRSFYLPENVKTENIEASYKDGILTITLPKEEEEKAKLHRQISIS